MIAALYVQSNGVYADLAGVDPWYEARDARTYAGPWPVVAHPPCARWGRYWGGGPSVSDALSGLVAPPAGAGLRGGANVSVTVIVQGASRPEDTAAAVGDELEERLAAIFGRLAEAT